MREAVATAARETMIERVAETDDELTMKFLEGEEISNEESIGRLRKATIRGELVPVLCGTALRNKGVQPLLDAVVRYLPSPLDVPPVEGHQPGHRRSGRRASRMTTEPFAALVFKIVTDPFVGRLAYVACLFGQAECGRARSTTRTATARNVWAVCCKCMPTSVKRSRRCHAGDIAAIVGPKEIVHGRNAV